ncbi:MAG: radical SAM protein [Planctomycetes bacterium]|nr:radical SAM protein [Planctomycetota bacterium]
MKNVNIIVPQYHSSFCLNNCIYCGFKNTNKSITRSRLSDADYKKEIQLLLSWGYRTIEFVYSSDRFFKPDIIAKRIEYAKELGLKNNAKVRIGLNTEPLDYEDYKTLKFSGLDFIVLWMETYSRSLYTYWHGAITPKSNYTYRYEAYERAIEAGIENYGLGVLFGLNYWKDEVIALINHANYLFRKYNQKPYIIGIPRIKQAHSVTLNGHLKPMQDNEFIEACNMYKQAFPDTMLFFNTRESFELNVKCCSNNDLFTIDCGTYPRAFLEPNLIKNGIEQFQTHRYARECTIKKLKQNNINPKFDW